MSFKYFFKEPKKEPEMKIFEGSNFDFYSKVDIMKDLLNQPFSPTGYVNFTANFCLYFDDIGIEHKDEGLIEYNCNIPSNNPAFQNQLFGNICIIKYDNIGLENECAVDISDEEFDKLKSYIFEVPSEQIYTKEFVSSFWEKLHKSFEK